MLNVNDLEYRHKKYKLKTYIPYFAITGSIIVLGFIISFVLYNSKIATENEELVQTDPNTTIQDKKIESIINDNNNETSPEVALEPELAKEDIEQEKVVLAPSLDFMRKMQSDSPVYYGNKSSDAYETEVVNKKKEIVTQQIKEEVHEETQPVIVEEVKEPVQKIEKKGSVSITRKDESNEIEHVIKRFKSNNSPALSLFIAKKYYQLGDYQQAYNYALTTNEINNNIEESWIIFSKSLMKMNKKEMAIQTLKKYIDYSNSSQAKQLLDEILSGKFK